MADEEVEIDFNANDKITPKLGRMSAAVGRLSKTVDQASQRFTSMVMTTVGFAGLFGLGSAIAGAKRYIDHVDRIANLTGLAADRVAGMSEALQISGVDAGEVEGILTRMVKRGAQLGEGNKAMATMAKRYGVNLKDGPEKSMVKIAGLVEQQKIGAGQVGRILGVQGATLANLMDAMQKGPAALNQMFEDATKKNEFLGGATMDQMQSYDESMNRVGLAWHRLTATVMVKLAPAIEKLAAKFEDSIEGWSAGAQKFGTFMVNNMDKIVAGAKLYAKIMFANAALVKLTGGGIMANVGRAGGMLKGGGGPAAMLAGMASAFSNLKGFLMGAVKLGPMIGMLLKFVGMFSVIGAVVAVIGMIVKNTEGAAQRLGKLFSSIWTNLKGLGSELAKLFGGGSPIGRFIQSVGRGFLTVIEWLLSGINALVLAARAFFMMINSWMPGNDTISYGSAKSLINSGDKNEKTIGGIGAANRIGDVLEASKGKVTDAQRAQFQKYDELIQAYAEENKMDLSKAKGYQALKKRFGGPGDASAAVPEMQVYQDFRGSRFDITQAFAEGFDPDRIAVAFANDISSIGERKLQSGFSPMFSIR